jgi:UDP-N-acetyl-D-mannosaminuronate dehydrogenase
VKETAFSGVFPTVSALASRGATALVHDPLFGDDELAAIGLTAYHVGEPVDAIVVQTDHPQYRTLGPADFPGARVLVDGRRVTDPLRWAGVDRHVLGEPSTVDALTG